MAAGPELPLSCCQERTPGDSRPRAVDGRSGAIAGPRPSTDSHVSPAGKAQQGLQEQYGLGSLLGRGGFGRVFAGTQLSEGAAVAIKRVPWNRVRHWGKLPNGTSALLEIVLLDRVSTGFPGVVQLLDWLELPSEIVMVLEHPERCQDLQHFIRALRFLSEEVARELFRQVLEAVRHCTSCGVLHRDIKPENILVDLATGQAKLIDFGCGTYLQDTAYTQFAGKEKEPLEKLDQVGLLLLKTASRETLHCAAKFLKWRDLEELPTKEDPLNIDECKLADDRSRAAEHLQNPQESLREAAMQFIGMAVRYMRM
ncbi:serine/threonine-protein kinase pim-1-like [Chamaea fasciata]|uniref:serine/threonine-protein kinase pim-1-like n=1 Tax=Chamaea fasciata TaxID=190680 RepID=UPI00336A6548